MDRFTWGIAGGALLLVVLGIASVVLLQQPSGPPDLSRPEGVVRAYVQALEAGRPEDAWALLAEAARQDVTRDEFIRRATQEGTFRRRTSRLAIESAEIDGSVARVLLARTYDSGGGLFGPSSFTERTMVRLVRESGAWRIEVPPEPFLIARRPV
jgi:hypothetical protein